MLAECVRTFMDLKAGVTRSAGERFEVEPDRMAEINATRYGQLVKPVTERPKTRRTRKKAGE